MCTRKIMVGKMFAGGCVSCFHFKTYSVRRPRPLREGTEVIPSSSLLKKVFEVSLWATLIQDPSARRTKDSQPSGFGFEYCASHVRFRVFQQTAIGNLGAPRCYPRAQIRQGADRVSAPTRRVTPRRAEACHQ